MSKEIHLEYSCLKYPLPKPLLTELSDELYSMNQYPSGADYCELSENIAEYFGISAEHILPCNGSDEVIESITRAFGGDLILIPTPTFSQYEVSAERNRLKKKYSPCLQGSSYQLNFCQDDLKEASLVWICNPNNPTGTPIPRHIIKKVLEQSHGIVAVDECNYEYLGETVIDLIDQYPNLVISRSFSKNFGLAGLRLGFAISSITNIKAIAQFSQIFRVNRLAEIAGIKVLKYIDYFQRLWHEIAENRDYFISCLKSIGIKVYPSKSNFVLIDFVTAERAGQVWQYLKKENIFVCATLEEEFSGLENHYLRFTISNRKEMNLVLQILENFMKKYP